MKLNFLHLSDSAFFSQEGKLNIIGIFDKMSAPNFPAISSFALSLGISGDRGSYNLTVRIIHSETNKKLLEISSSVNVPIVIKETGGSANFVAKLVGVAFEKEGRYLIQLDVDGEPLECDHILIFEKIS